MRREEVTIQGIYHWLCPQALDLYDTGMCVHMYDFSAQLLSLDKQCAHVYTTGSYEAFVTL